MSLSVNIVHNIIKLLTTKDYKRYVDNSHDPMTIQKQYLLSLINKNSRTHFGQKYGFSQIRSIADFQKTVPISTYEDYQPYIDEIAAGKPFELTDNPVLKFVPTSGTSGFNKFIPYTKSTLSEFNLALNVWMHSLYLEYPTLKNGRAFWLISPSGNLPELKSSVSVGFESDDSYFGKVGSRLINKIMVLPAGMAMISNAQNHLYITCIYLLNANDLNLISVWNPTFINVILKYIVNNKSLILESIRTGNFRLPENKEKNLIQNFVLTPNLHRSEQLDGFIIEGDIFNTNWSEIWPNLKLISCWTDAWAAHSIPQLQKLFKNVSIQGKGLLSTEAAITIPLMGKHLPAYFSHFFEFIDFETQEVKLLNELELGKSYEVVVTIGSGLYRYRLNDLVKVTSYFHKLPNLEFIGKSNIVSDLVGEKLSEPSVSTVLNQIRNEYNISSEVFFIAPCIIDNVSFYTLYVDGENILPIIIDKIDKELQKIFYYAHARNFNQLSYPRIYNLNQDGVDGYREQFTSKNVQGTTKYLTLNKQLNLFEKLSGKFIN